MTNQNFDIESYVNNFLSAYKVELMKISSENGFSFLEEELLFIQSHLRDKKKALPTYNQLNFFSEISRIRQQEKTTCAISSVATNSPKESIIFETAKDLLEKKNICQEKIFGATPLAFTSHTASEYLRYIDCAEKDVFFVPSEKAQQTSYYIHTSDRIPLFSLTDTENQKDKQKKEEPTTKKNAIAILSPKFEMSQEEYKQKAESFFSSHAGQFYISNYKAITGAFGLFGILAKENDGILVNLLNIPAIEKDENGKISSITSLLGTFENRYIFDLDPINTMVLNHVAEEFGLSVSSFAIRDSSGLFSLVRLNCPAFCFKTEFLLDLINFKESKKYVFSDESEKAIDSKNPVFLTSNKADGRHTYSAEKVLMFTKVIASATSRKLKNSPYKTASIAVLDAITSLVSKGVAKDTITLSIHYSLLSQTDDPLELGKNFSAILGAYRTMIELCVSDFEPQISYSSTKRSITVTASAKPPYKKLDNRFAEKESFIYFLPISYDDDGNPDYEKYRYMLKYFYLLFEKDAILSSFSVNENLSSVILNASQRNNISFFEDINSAELSSSHGILFETYKELPFENTLIAIGKNIPFAPTE